MSGRSAPLSALAWVLLVWVAGRATVAWLPGANDVRPAGHHRAPYHLIDKRMPSLASRSAPPLPIAPAALIAPAQATGLPRLLKPGPALRSVSASVADAVVAADAAPSAAVTRDRIEVRATGDPSIPPRYAATRPHFLTGSGWLLAQAGATRPLAPLLGGSQAGVRLIFGRAALAPTLRVDRAF